MSSITGIVPHLIVRDASAAIAFYERAFGADVLFVLVDPSDERIGHAELKLGESTFMLADEYPDFGALSPDTVGGTPVTFHLSTQNLTSDVETAVLAGAVLLRRPTDQEFGERTALVLDPFGHRWRLSQTVEEMSPQEMQARWRGERA